MPVGAPLDLNREAGCSKSICRSGWRLLLLPSSRTLAGMHARISLVIELAEANLRATTRLTEEIHMATLQLQKLIKDVQDQKTVIDGAITLIKRIPDLIRDAGAGGPADQAALDDLAAQIEIETSALKDALVANTPTDPPVPTTETTPVTGEGTPPTT